MTPRTRTALLGAMLLSAAAWADSGWREIQSPHVRLRTDLGSRAAREATLAVERFRAEIIAAAWPRATLPAVDRIEVVVYANGLDFEQQFGRRLGGVFFHEVPPLAVLYGTPDRWERRANLATSETTSVLRHELVHHLAAIVYRRQPRWFAEGLAQFLETIRPSSDGKALVLGAANLQAIRSYHAYRSVTVADALAWSGKLDGLPEGTVHGLYGLSWLMVHWLFNAHPAQFDQLQVLLAKGIDPAKAWKIILPGLGVSDLDAELYQYAKHGNYQEYLAPFTPPTEAGFKEVVLSESEVHAERARVALAAARAATEPEPHREEARRELARALEIEPANVSALLLQARGAEPSDRLELGRRLTEAHPEDGRSWLLLARSLGSSPGVAAERQAAYRKAVELKPDDATALNSLAWMYVQSGKASEAAPLIGRAVELAPYDPGMLDTLAAVQSQLGRCSEAVASQARAVDSLPDGVSAAVRRRFEERLERYRSGCAAAPPADVKKDP